MCSPKAPKGYRVGDPHPNHEKDIYEKEGQKEPSIPTGEQPGQAEGVVRGSDGGGQGVCDGITGHGTASANTEASASGA